MLEYPQYISLPAEYVKNKLAEFLAEDAPNGDVTAIGTIDENISAVALIESQDELVFAGVPIIENMFNDDFSVEVFVEDGEKLTNGSLIGKISGNAREILTKERVLLNLIQRLSGIATLASKYAEIAKPYNVRILDTRKTTPGLRLFEKYAVAVGGGFNHRLDLSSGILIKDNHIQAAGSITNAVNRIRKIYPEMQIELEVENEAHIIEGLECRVEGFLLDNMNIENTVKSVELIRKAPKGNDILIESSGGITIATLSDYVKTGINAISIGALTHSAKSANIHLEFLQS